jgi:site-specific DNA recombinase
MGKVFAYTRVSTVKQGEKGVSLQEQKDAILRYALKQGLEISRWFEEQETASKQGRSAFTQMLQLLRLRTAEGVIIHKIDRSARNLEDWVDVGKLVDAGVDIHFATEALDLKTVAGRLSADIQAVVAAHYSRNLREEAKKGIYGRLKQGFYPLPAPIGYMDQGAAKAKVPDPVMAPLVTEIFELYATGKFSLPQLVNHMHERGLRNRSGGPVTMHGLSTILKNPFYAGVMRIKKTGQDFAGNHLPLVSRDLFERVQLLLKGKAVDRKTRHAFLFSRLVRCASCRYSLIGERRKGHTYYRCHNRPLKTPPVCPKTTIREQQLETIVLSRLEALTLSDAELRSSRNWIEEYRRRATEERGSQLSTAKLRLESLRARMSRLADLLIDGSVDKTIFEEKQKLLIWEETELKQSLTSLESGNAPALNEMERIVGLAKNPSLLYKQSDAGGRRELLRILVSDVTASGKNVSLELKIPFQLIAEREKHPDGRPYRRTCRTWEQILGKLKMYFEDHSSIS